ncbi:MAG: hypothetical protein PVTTEEND_001156 [Candidatus Fervidibacter sp.]
MLLPTPARERATAKGLAIATLVYGTVVVIAYLVGWISLRGCEWASAIPCWLVASWYVAAAWRGEATPLHRWGWLLLAIGWALVGAAFAFRPGTGRWVSLSSAVPALLGGFGTVWLANWQRLESEQAGEGGNEP